MFPFPSLTFSTCLPGYLPTTTLLVRADERRHLRITIAAAVAFWTPRPPRAAATSDHYLHAGVPRCTAQRWWRERARDRAACFVTKNCLSRRAL